MRFAAIYFLALQFPCLFFGQTKFDYTIHARVDTSKAEVRDVVKVWISYLASKPDSIYDNPWWNEAEKKALKDFDLSRKFMYQLPSEQLLNYFKPTILSVEKEGQFYSIKTLFFAEGLEGMYRKSNPWCINRLYVVKENGQWKMKNALPVLTERWRKKTCGKITFIFPPEHPFNKALAKRSVAFCDRIAKQFQFPGWKPLNYYIAQSGDEMGRLLGFDFSLAAYTTGVGMNEERMLFSGTDSEWYPHELVHMLVENTNAHSMINEGFATWQGGAVNGKTFEELVKPLAQKVAENDTVTFYDVLDKKWGWQYFAFYTTGAVLCKAVYEARGAAGIQALLKTSSTNDAFVTELCQILSIKKEELNGFWKKELAKHQNK